MTATTTISCPQLLLDGRLAGPGRVALRDGAIEAVALGAGSADVVLDHGVLTPGMVDLQLNGAAGVDLAHADAAGWERVAAHLASHGVTAFAPTFVTAPLERLREALEATAAARAALGDGVGADEASRGADGAADNRPPAAQPLRAHLEGPFLSPARPGAHGVPDFREPTPEALDGLLGAAHADTLGIVTLAPELPGALDAIERLRAAGVAVSLGHSDATAAQAGAAADRGATLVTHLFNAQRPFTHREPGLPGRALADPRLTSGLIADLHHVAPEALALAFAAAPGRIALVSDAVAAAGMAPGPFRIGPVEATAYADGPPRLPDGTLAGSALHLDEAVRNVVGLGLDRAAALQAATSVPAGALGDATRGRLAPGRRADLVWWDDALRVRGVWVGGRRVAVDGSSSDRR